MTILNSNNSKGQGGQALIVKVPRGKPLPKITLQVRKEFKAQTENPGLPRKVLGSQ